MRIERLLAWITLAVTFVIALGLYALVTNSDSLLLSTVVGAWVLVTVGNTALQLRPFLKASSPELT